MFINNTNLGLSSMKQDTLYLIIQIRASNVYYLTGWDKIAASWVTNNATNRFSKNAIKETMTAALYAKRDANAIAKKVNGYAISVQDIKRMRTVE